MKKLLFVRAIGLAALTSASADEPRGSLGLGRMHGWNAGASVNHNDGAAVAADDGYIELELNSPVS